MRLLTIVLPLALAVVVHAAEGDSKERIRAIRDLAKTGASAIERIQPYLKDTDVSVRVEAVKAIADLGTQQSLDPLIQATADNDPEVQIRAVGGLLKFYDPESVKTGLSGSIGRVGGAIKSKFTDTNDRMIDPYIQVRPDVIQALGRVVRGGASVDARAEAARALGILRGRAAVPDLLEALKSKDSRIIYESLVALQKIRDESAGPGTRFLLKDLDERVQVTAIETAGLLEDRGAVNDLRNVLDTSRSSKVRRAALTSLAQLADPSLHGLFTAYLSSRDEDLRAAAAEGLGRLGNVNDMPALQSAYSTETKTPARLAEAFAQVRLGNRELSDFSPLRYIVDQLNSAAYRGVARAYLIELARDPSTRLSLYQAFGGPVVTKAEKTGLAQVFAASGDRDSLPYLERLSKDPDAEVAQEGVRAVRNLNARL